MKHVVLNSEFFNLPFSAFPGHSEIIDHASASLELALVDVDVAQQLFDFEFVIANVVLVLDVDSFFGVQADAEVVEVEGVG